MLEDPKEKARKRAADLLARALKPSTKHEGNAASLALGKHIVKNPWLLESHKGRSVADEISHAQEAFSKAAPTIKETANAVTQAAAAGLEFAKGVASIFGRR
jgi:hypothetical protein